MATHYSEEFYQRKTKIPENSKYNAHQGWSIHDIYCTCNSNLLAMYRVNQQSLRLLLFFYLPTQFLKNHIIKLDSQLLLTIASVRIKTF